MDWKMVPQSNAKDKPHQDYYNKLLSKKLNCPAEGAKQSFRCNYGGAHIIGHELNENLVMENLDECTFSINGKIVCKSCNDWKGIDGEHFYKCLCGNIVQLDLTVTNLNTRAKVNINVSIETPNLKVKQILNTTTDLQKNGNYQQTWHFELSKNNGNSMHHHSSSITLYGSDYLSENGDLILICDIRVLQLKYDANVSNIKEHIAYPGVHSKLAELFSDLNINPTASNIQHTDVVLCVEKNKVHCHKVILSIASKYFERMFATDMKEAKNKEVALKDIDLDTLKSLLNFIYKDIVAEEEINAKLLAAADYYEVLGLRSICSKKLSKDINLNNVAEIWLTAYLHNIEDLAHDAIIFMSENWESLAKQDDIRELCQNYTSLLFTISTLLAHQ